MGKIGCESKSVAFVDRGNLLKANKEGQGATREKERGRAKIIIKAFVILIKNIGFVSNELQSKKRQSCKIP